MPRSVAFFDFDETLVKGDSFFPFLILLAGRLPTYRALAQALTLYLLMRVRGQKPELRYFIKDKLIRLLLVGRRVDDAASAAVRLQKWRCVKLDILEALKKHHANGDHIVIASGGLDLYLPHLLRDIPHHDLICTEISVAGGVVTGDMIKGNCVREGKADRVAAWLNDHKVLDWEGFDGGWAYGNYPHDVPMMAHLRFRIIVS